ncbi:hypothetical protein FHU10_5260 [Serratia fonticola]|uniref:Uncharacterized protein n=1 Tax=Serratia fonticola TaxID=47917 RepID=A0A542BFI4_SERFO|nr:hypothetical protein [Serratia fonticola]TQI77341.1 hypothetical protein FHU09_5339 [Serratia fonticola]TQI93616.1 hypothetical protein FHU11_5309 [Serratia fonticola]TVZ61565.1 hypothetical protein FHU10_5260 [Serratia fonticola]
MTPEIKRLLRKLPLIKHLPALRVIYSPKELERLEEEARNLGNEYNRLAAAGPAVLEEFRKDNPHVASELHIRELIAFRASRLKQELDWKEICLARARKYSE